MPKAHALLSASGAKRWISCPPSARLEEQFPDVETEYAREGTLAHQLAELALRYNNHELTKRTYTVKLQKLEQDPQYSQEMREYIHEYTEIVWEAVQEARAACPDAQALFEQRLDYSAYVPEGFGTGDVVIIADDTIHVIDLKYGKGVGVSAKENPQLRLYGLGAYLEHSLLYDIRKIKMTIVQPRLDYISSEELTAEELLAWAEGTVRPRAELAIKGEGEFCIGDHCRFCRAQKDYQMELVRYDFAKGALLEDAEIGEVLTCVGPLVKWAQAIQDYAFSQAVHQGKQYDGWKLVEGRSNRKYTDEVAVAKALADAGYQEIYKPREIYGISAMEKLVGKKKLAELLEGLIEKPEGKPVLVQESDARPALRTVEKIKEDFDKEENQ